jgi:hypothetical protein
MGLGGLRFSSQTLMRSGLARSSPQPSAENFDSVTTPSPVLTDCLRKANDRLLGGPRTEFVQLACANSQSASPGSANARAQTSCPASLYSV